MRIYLPIAAAIIASLGASYGANVGDAKGATPIVVRCSGKTYGGIDRNGFPVISQLRAINLPRRTDGYAPRCLVAETIAGQVQRRQGSAPLRLRIHGARWDAGTWFVTRRFVRVKEGEVAKFTATHGRQRVTFTGSS